jgi:small ligand-binding sensory domain FIST
VSKTTLQPCAAAALSTAVDTRAAVNEVCEQVLASLGGPPDLALAFVSPHHEAGVAAALCDGMGTDNLLGCTGEAIAGPGREIEGQPAISLWAARLPGVTAELLHLDFERNSEGGSFGGWPAALEEAWPAGSTLLLLGEPFSFPADFLLERLNEDRPGVAIAGGMASGGWQPGQNRVWRGRQEWNAGAVAALIHGPIRLRSVVSQGCRPIGKPMVVTRAQRNIVQELSGKPALAQFSELFPTLSPADQELVRGGLHLGRVINEYQDHFGRGDFLVRNVTGADRESGAFVLGDYVRVGQTVQFHIRDAGTADEDLRELLAAAGTDGSRPLGALLFTCNGRGARLFDAPHHDAAAIDQQWPGLPVAGFFAQGEIGPVGGRNFLHGFTASVLLVESLTRAE